MSSTTANEPKFSALLIEMEAQGSELIKSGKIEREEGYDLVRQGDDKVSKGEALVALARSLAEAKVAGSTPTATPVVEKAPTPHLNGKKLTTGDAIERVLQGAAGHKMHKEKIFEEIQPIVAKCASIQALTTALSSDKRFTSIGGGSWTLAEVDLLNADAY